MSTDHPTSGLIYLLDHNFTLVENSHVKKSPFTKQIEVEEYRLWLVKLLHGQRVLLVTARPAKYEEQTLARIAATTDLQLQGAYFNIHGLRPPQAKQRALEDLIFPTYGADPTQYYALESNPLTRGMYKKFGIAATKVPDNERWLRLPTHEFPNPESVALSITVDPDTGARQRRAQRRLDF